MSIDSDSPPTSAERYRFGGFELDVADRQLWRSGRRVDLNARYMDALILLVREQGKLVEKDRFFEIVWGDVVVSDSALSQGIKEIRRVLGDDAASPRFVQTVPRHGYRFVADVTSVERAVPERLTFTNFGWSAAGIWGAATAGGAAAGLAGGMLYGFGLSSPEGGVGTLSTLLVLVVVNVLVGAAGGLGVGLGLAGAHVARLWTGRTGPVFQIAGAAAGGLLVGTLSKLVGIDAFHLLFGRAPAGITGGPEGAVLGAALAIGALLGTRWSTPEWGPALGAATVSALAGTAIPLLGGHLMGGSLSLLAQSFADSQLELDRFAVLFGDIAFDLTTEAVLAGIEGFLFGGCVVAAVELVRRRHDQSGHE